MGGYFVYKITKKIGLALAAGFSFSFVRTKKKKQKEKRRLRSGAKKSSYFPKRKELASLKQLFVLNGKYSIFLHAPPLRPEANEEYGDKKIRQPNKHWLSDKAKQNAS